jgi:DNA-binding NarL/FixJ family response regulator
MVIPRSPVRVFLVSDHALLRESLARVLRNHAGILLVGAEEFSTGSVAEVAEFACDVLLVDPSIIAVVDAQIPAKPGRFSNLRILKVEMEAGIADLISQIVSVASSQRLFGGLPRLSSR